MIKIAIEVRSSAARFKVALVAESIEGAGDSEEIQPRQGV